MFASVYFFHNLVISIVQDLSIARREGLLVIKNLLVDFLALVEILLVIVVYWSKSLTFLRREL